MTSFGQTHETDVYSDIDLSYDTPLGTRSSAHHQQNEADITQERLHQRNHGRANERLPSNQFGQVDEENPLTADGLCGFVDNEIIHTYGAIESGAFNAFSWFSNSRKMSGADITVLFVFIVFCLALIVLAVVAIFIPKPKENNSGAIKGITLAAVIIFVATMILVTMWYFLGDNFITGKISQLQELMEKLPVLPGISDDTILNETNNFAREKHAHGKTSDKYVSTLIIFIRKNAKSSVDDDLSTQHKKASVLLSKIKVSAERLKKAQQLIDESGKVTIFVLQRGARTALACQALGVVAILTAIFFGCLK